MPKAVRLVVISIATLFLEHQQINDQKRLARLGSNPQFGTLKNYTTTQEVYDHLKRAYRTNDKGNAAELDKLWRAMGFTGFNDERFYSSSINPCFFYDVGG